MAFDLDDEELRATRRDKGLDDVLYEEDLKKELLQRPISFLTEENLDKLETHCLRAIRFERGVEHKVVLELLKRYKEYSLEREQDKKRIQELEADNRKLKAVRIEYDYGYENIHFCTKNDLVRIDKNKYLIEIKDGKFVDIKQLYIDTLNSIPKQKVKEALEDIEYYFERLNGPDEDIEYIRQLKQELLEGEK